MNANDPQNIQADLAAMMLNVLEHGPTQTSGVLATLADDELRAYLIGAVQLGATMVEVESRVLLDHGMRTAGPVLALLARTVANRICDDLG